MQCTSAFIVRYAADSPDDLRWHPGHEDNCNITINFCLGADFKGGDLSVAKDTVLAKQAIARVADEVKKEHASYLPECMYHSIAQQPGRALLHDGHHLHGARDVPHGERYNLIIVLGTVSQKPLPLLHLPRELQMGLLSRLDRSTCAPSVPSVGLCARLRSCNELWTPLIERLFDLRRLDIVRWRKRTRLVSGRACRARAGVPHMRVVPAKPTTADAAAARLRMRLLQRRRERNCPRSERSGL